EMREQRLAAHDERRDDAITDVVLDVSAATNTDAVRDLDQRRRLNREMQSPRLLGRPAARREGVAKSFGGDRVRARDPFANGIHFIERDNAAHESAACTPPRTQR